MKINYSWRVFFDTKKIEKAKRVWQRTGIKIPEKAETNKFEEYWKTKEIVASFFYSIESISPAEAYLEASTLLQKAIRSFVTSGPTFFDNGFECHFSMEDSKVPGISHLFLDIFNGEGPNELTS